ncbi:hypothetical protein [Streptosporangium sp. NPDC000396]|uniref:hypothetical protein n=1 Tax=Streptosporangium sp. NPDC000396 TaxID=3366185 RepID=UPI003691BCC5
MRIRILAAAVVTAGALMATLTGAANAAGAPAPAPSESFTVQCEGGGQMTVTARKLSDAEIKELEGGGRAAEAVPAERMDPAKLAELKDVKVNDVKIIADAPGQVARAEKATEGVMVEATPATPLSEATDVMITAEASGQVTRVDKAPEGAPVLTIEEGKAPVPGSLAEDRTITCAKQQN